MDSHCMPEAQLYLTNILFEFVVYCLCICINIFSTWRMRLNQFKYICWYLIRPHSFIDFHSFYACNTCISGAFSPVNSIICVLLLQKALLCVLTIVSICLKICNNIAVSVEQYICVCLFTHWILKLSCFN